VGNAFGVQEESSDACTWDVAGQDVYIIFLPATSMVSLIVPTMARTPLLAHRFRLL
jgi:cytochrome c oxidase subunit I+III